MLLEPEGNGFHLLDGDKKSITGACWERWLDLSDWEIREALGLVDEARYKDLFRRYVVHVSHALKRERLFDEVTGELTEPDERFMKRLESTMAPDAGPSFRAEVLSRIGAWALSHPNEDPAYDEIFPDYFALLREDYYKKQKESVRKSLQRMLEVLSERDEPVAEEVSLSAVEEANARHALETLLGEHDGTAKRERHTRETLRETLVHLAKHRY
jgi:predicted Ser/Thr protein kinase